MNDFEWAGEDKIKALSREPFGLKLANKVADQLEKGMLLAYTHRDYGGDGLYFDKGKYIWTSIFDGWPQSTRAEWDNREAFVQFLAGMSDYSCCGGEGSPEFLQNGPFELNNQRITRARLLESVV